jgi:hypothetical protein
MRVADGRAVYVNARWAAMNDGLHVAPLESLQVCKQAAAGPPVPNFPAEPAHKGVTAGRRSVGVAEATEAAKVEVFGRGVVKERS